ncbi:aspartyl protease family protein At5g10770 [Humulus lupulus]|uniref:aspartyl protease family protein At5g10770 n=1 Tax=Humulus lupulus TaxID=3486 RepID=UPI002B4053BA|nr:aspartyl protease family protein At5g10770 [Humulus lupulus]
MSSTMVDVDIRPLLLLFLLSLNFSANGVLCFPEKKLLNLRDFQWKQPNIGASNCVSSHKSKSVNGATILEMKHRDHCSDKMIDWNKKLKKRLVVDDLHVRSLQSQFKTRVSPSNIVDKSTTQIPITSGIKLEILNYIVTIELGGKNLTVIVDTGSDLTWVQCQPCKSCYNQKDPLFNPSSSHSYQPIWCNSTTCQALQFATGNSGVCGIPKPPASSSSCNYMVSYGDGSYTRGDIGNDHLRLGTTPINGFVFGCGRNNKGLFGGASGLMGLGRSELSLISQTDSLFEGVFSYCLPSSTLPSASGSLVMGFDPSAYKNSTPISFTKMVQNPQLPTFYFLNLTGISVGGVNLKASSFGKGGILIDSGTVITRLAPSIYKVVKEEFVKQFSGFPSAPGFSILDTCFNLSGYDQVNLPILKMHFDGTAELSIDVTGVLYMVKTDASQICLALASLSYEEEIGIVGNYQQKNQRVVYDTKGSKLGFAEETCSFK